MPKMGHFKQKFSKLCPFYKGDFPHFRKLFEISVFDAMEKKKSV